MKSIADFILYIFWLYCGLHFNEVGNTAYARQIPDCIFCRFFLVIPIHFACQGEPTFFDFKLNFFFGYAGVPFQMIQCSLCNVLICTLQAPADFYVNFLYYGFNTFHSQRCFFSSQLFCLGADMTTEGYDSIIDCYT